LPLLGTADRMAVIDIVDFGEPPGTLVELRGAEIPRITEGRKVSLHQTSFLDVLAAAELIGSLPADIVVIGVQAGDLEDFGAGLTPPVAARMDEALDRVAGCLAGWGYPLAPRA
ncbi:MAG: hydrogenase maturation protease, partial [Actinomycetota bacterium]